MPKYLVRDPDSDTDHRSSAAAASDAHSSVMMTGNNAASKRQDSAPVAQRVPQNKLPPQV